MSRGPRVTLVEVLTLLVALVVIAAVAIPLWHTHRLREQRRQAMDVLQAIQAAQDRHFGEHARYADLEQLKVAMRAPRYRLQVTRSEDSLGYVATATALAGADGQPDRRCAQMSIDQHGRRSARDDAGKDSTGDCWDRK